MGLESFKSILDKFDATPGDVYAAVLMTNDGLALVSTSPQDHAALGYDADKVSAISASIMGLGDKFMDDFFGGELDQVLIQGKAGNMLSIRHGQDMALTVLTKPDAEHGLIFSQMKRVADSLGELCGKPVNDNLGLT